MLIYLITNTVNGKRYVGQTIKSLSRRWANHKNSAISRGASYLHRAIRKYGSDNFSTEELAVVHTKEDLDFYEIFMIKELDLRNPQKGYNLTDGGEGTIGFKFSEESRKLLSRRPRSEQRYRKVSDALKGRVFSEESRKRMSESAKGKVLSEECRKKISESSKGKVISEDCRRKMSVARKRYWQLRKST